MIGSASLLGPQYTNHDADGGTTSADVNTIEAVEHAPASPLRLVSALSEGGEVKTPHTLKPSPPQLVV